MGGAHPRYCRESDAGGELGADALRGHHGAGVLQGGSSGPVPCAFHHGQRIHRVRDYPHDPAVGRPAVARADGAEPGVLRFVADRRLGVREHVHGTSLGLGVGEERSTAHEHGYCMVVCRLAGGMAQQEEGRPAETKSAARTRDHSDRVGDECASAGPGIEHARAYGVRVDLDGRRGREDRGDILRAAGSQHAVRDGPGGHQQLAVPHALRKSSISSLTKFQQQDPKPENETKIFANNPYFTTSYCILQVSSSWSPRKSK